MPYGSAVYLNLINALAKFDKNLVTLKTIDSWGNPEIAREYGSMYSDTFINGRTPPFCSPNPRED